MLFIRNTIPATIPSSPKAAMRSSAVLVLFILHVSLTAVAQEMTAPDSSASRTPFAKGTYLLSGSLSYTKSEFPTDNITMRTLTVAPSFLFFTSKHFALGGQIAYTATDSKTKYSEGTLTMVTIGPMFRLYPFDSDPLLFLFAGVSMSSASRTSDSFVVSGPSSSFAQIGFGFDFLNSSLFSIEPFVEYKWSILEDKSTTEGITLGVSFVSFHP